MDKIVQFLKRTKIISRVLVVLWVFFSSAGAGFDASQFVYTFPIMAIFFLLPAILIERKKNPVWVKARNEAKIKKFEAEIVANQQRKEEAIRLQQLKEESERSKKEADLEMAKATPDISDNLPLKNDVESVANIPQEVSTITEQPEDSQSTTKEISLTKNKKNKAPLSHRIFGAIFAFFGASFVLSAVLGMNYNYESGLLGLLVGGIVIGVFGVLFLTGAMRKAEQTKQIKGVYLTKEQIEKLEQKVELPIIDTPVFLNYGEVAVYHSQATRQETKNRVIGRTGSYGGDTVRIAKWLSIHTGGSSSRPIYGDVSMQYPGEFIITNERVIFLSSQKGFELKHQNIIAATAYKDGFAFQSKNTGYVLLVPRADLATLAFDGVRTGEIPIAEIDTLDDYDYDDYDEFDPDDISSIDGMEGHDFEYFCADLLRRNDFSGVSVTKGSGDQGVDVLATKGGIKYAIQCKNYASALGNTPVQEVNAGKTFYNCHVGVVMTNSTFTPGAKTLAQATGVLLWDRVVLQKMMEDAE